MLELVYREPEARICDTDLDFLKVGPERQLHAAVSMQLKLQWKTQDISHVRYMGHSQPPPSQKKPEWNHFQRKVRSIKNYRAARVRLCKTIGAQMVPPNLKC